MVPAPGTLQKEDVFPGAILWLDNNADDADRVTYRRSDLTRGALDHPVLVVDTLGDNHEFLWMTGTSNATPGDIPVAFSSVFGTKREATHCSHCDETHVYDFGEPCDMLHHENHTAKMCKPTHVRVTKVYEVSMRMLRLERSCDSVSDWTIDRRSLILVLELSEKERGRLAASSHAVRLWPLPAVVDFNQSDPPYPGSDFNPEAGTYSGFFPESKGPEAKSESSLDRGARTLKAPNQSGASAALNPVAFRLTSPAQAPVAPASTTKVAGESFPTPTATANPSGITCCRSASSIVKVADAKSKSFNTRCC